MLETIHSKKSKSLITAYNKAMQELEQFFSFKWTGDKPQVFLVPDRKTINSLLESKTEDWVVGWVSNCDVCVLDKENFEKESCHKYSDKDYNMLIKHELAHVFTKKYSDILNRSIYPDWLWEGLALYLANELDKKNKPKEFKDFLKYYRKSGPGVYIESGYVVELLVKKFGKSKLLKLIKELKEVKTKAGFNKKFKSFYGFDLTYKNINEIL